jgi:hypothetical protein
VAVGGCVLSKRKKKPEWHVEVDKVQEDGSITYKASLKRPLEYVTIDLRGPEGK